MANLAKTATQWERLLGEEFAGGILAPMLELEELYDKFTRERTQLRFIDSRGYISAISMAGVRRNVNCTIGYRFYVRIAANGGNWDVNIYKATGAGGGDLVAHVTNKAASSTSSLVADNSSGITGSITLGASPAAVANDTLVLEAVLDYPARLPLIWTQEDSIEQDKFMRTRAAATYSEVATSLLNAIGAMRALADFWGVGVARDMPIARGNGFNNVEETTLVEDREEEDGEGNVVRSIRGLLAAMTVNMQDEGTGGEQDVIRRVVAASAATFDASNTGKGTVASHTPLEKAPVGRWTFQCDDGADTGALGRETFSGSFVATDGSGITATFSGLQVEKDFDGPRGFGTVTLRRTYAKTGDGSNLNLAAVTTGIFVGENDQNTNVGVLYWKVQANGGNFDFLFYSDSGRTRLVAQATNIAAAAAFTATPYGTAGITVVWTAGSAPVDTTTGTISCQPFVTSRSADGQPDRFYIDTSITGTPGRIQKLLSDRFDGYLNSDASGSETIEDAWMTGGTFPDFAVQDN